MKDIYRTYGIYEISNLVNGMIYVGQTANSFGDRWDCHKAALRGGYHFSKELQNDWNRYGENSFEFVVVKDCTGSSTEEIDLAEKQKIKEIKDLGVSYNLHDGGHDGYYLGKHLSEETKNKIGEKNHYLGLGRKASEETKKKMSESQKRRYAQWTEEDRRSWGVLVGNAQRGMRKPSLSIKMKGNKNGATLSIEQVREVKRLANEEHQSNRQIADKTGIKICTVANITSGRRWADV